MKLLISLLLNAFALIITAYIVPGFHISNFTNALLAAIILGFINAFIKPVLTFLTAPLNIISFGLFAFVVNAILLWLATLITPGFTIDSFLQAILAAIVLSVVSTVLNMLLHDLGKARR